MRRSVVPTSVPRTLAALAALGAVALPATAAAQSDWPPADKQEYVDSGRYLADVQAAAAPAKAWLVSRTDGIAADRAACTAAGLPFPAPVPPAAPAASRAARFATAPAAAAAARGATPAASRAATPAWDGATTLVPDRRSAAVRRLRAAGARLTGAPATDASWSRVLLRASGVSFRGSAASVAHAGGVRLRAGRRSVTLRSVRLLAATDGEIRLTAVLGRSRTTVLTGRAPKAGRTLDRGAGVLRVPATRMRLTAGAARRLRSALGVRRLPAGAFGTLSLRAARAGATTPGTPAPGAPAPAPAPAPVATAPPTAASCAAIPARPAIVLDIDETALSNYLGTFGDPEGGSAGYAAVSVFGAGTALQPVFDIYAEARRRGVAVFFITARPGIIEASTVANLRRVGYTAWDGLTFKNDLASAKDVHKTAERKKVEDAGYRIVLNVGDQQTDIDGGYAERAFKLPNPFY